MTSKKLLPPIHPGEILAEEFMKPLELSASALARAIDVTPARVNEIAKGERSITAETAMLFGRYFGTTPDFWMNLQQRYDLEMARDAMQAKLKKISPLETKFLRHADAVREVAKTVRNATDKRTGQHLFAATTKSEKAPIRKVTGTPSRATGDRR